MNAFRGSILHCLADPGEASSRRAWEYFEDGLLVVEDGMVAAVGEAATLEATLPEGAAVTDYRGKLIVPGFIDCHVHFPQLDIIGSFGAQLLDWLNQYAYPAEAKFADLAYARDVASVFVDELLRNGTTTALVFGTVHAHSADAIFEAAETKGMRLVAGKVLMDSNCPENLRDDSESAYTDSKALIEKWHGRGRLGYAITPRFALTSSVEQLAAAGRLAAEYPDVWVHTHLAENMEEVAEIALRFPESRSYLDVYDSFGLLREKSVFAHCLHMDHEDRSCMAKKGGAAAFCPTSNLFLGSGLFDLPAMRAAGEPVAVENGQRSLQGAASAGACAAVDAGAVPGHSRRGSGAAAGRQARKLRVGQGGRLRGTRFRRFEPDGTSLGRGRFDRGKAFCIDDLGGRSARRRDVPARQSRRNVLV